MWQVMKTTRNQAGEIITSTPVGEPYADKECANRFAERCAGAEDHKTRTVYDVVKIDA